MNERKARPSGGSSTGKARDAHQPDHLETQRAEEMVDQFTQTVAGYASKIGLQILKGAALAREEAEDIWAEAQSMRRSREP